MDRIWPALFVYRRLVGHHTDAPARDTPCRRLSRGCMRVWYHGHKINVNAILELLSGNNSRELYRCRPGGPVCRSFHGGIREPAERDTQLSAFFGSREGASG
jgi:hypothetical protein